MARSKSNKKILQDINEIKEELLLLQQEDMLEYLLVNEDNTKYLYLEKLITIADVVGYGKYLYKGSEKTEKDVYSTEKLKRRAKKDYLFYDKIEDISKYEKKNKKFFAETKQTSIALPNEFYEFVGKKIPREEKDYDLNGCFNCLLVNSSILTYFNQEVTNKTLVALERAKRAQKVELKPGIFTPISLNVSVHGIGKQCDDVFHALRGNIFAKDKITILAEKKANGEINIFVMFFRNPRFYMANKMGMNSYLIDSFEFMKKEKQPEESRRGQAKWRKTLAELSIGIECGDRDYVVCPFTLLEVKYPSEETLLRASHIKAYAKCKNSKDEVIIDEAYDPENGFLVTANVDALFDKYLITVDPDSKQIIKSKVISDKLIKDLGIQKRIDEQYISEEKKKYLQVHYDEFKKKEVSRL